MNFTRDYDDDLDGNFLACKPGSVAPGLEAVCTFGIPILGFLALGNGIWLLYLAYIIRRHKKHQAEHTRGIGHVLNGRNSLNLTPQRSRETFSYTEKLFISGGICQVSYGILFFTSGFGTMFPSTHIRGQIGDVASAITSAAMWYIALLQHRGAKYFKSKIPQPQGGHNGTAIKTRIHKLTLSKLLDMMQSYLAPIITLIFWGLFRAGLYSRGWFVFYSICFQGIYGFRSFISTVFQRLATLQHVAHMVSGKSGTAQEMIRRNNFLTREFLKVVSILTFVFFAWVLWPVSLIIFGSTFNSRQFAIHTVAINVPVEMTSTFTNILTHMELRRSQKKRISNWNKQSWTMRGNHKVSPSCVPKGMSLPPGSSVVEQSTG